MFGFILTPDYDEIIEKNWSLQFLRFSSSLKSWSSRVIDTLHQKAKVLTIFALSKIWFRAQVLPLPNKYAAMFKKEISAFLWKGQMTRNVLTRDTICLPKERGGLGIPHIRIKCKSLFIRQLFRTILDNGKGKQHLDFWLGNRLGLPQLQQKFFHIECKSKKIIDVTPQLFKTSLLYISSCLEKAIFQPSEIETLTTKNIYSCFIEDLPDPVIVQNGVDRNWPRIWQRLMSGVLSPEARSILYLLIHQ